MQTRQRDNRRFASALLSLLLIVSTSAHGYAQSLNLAPTTTVYPFDHTYFRQLQISNLCDPTHEFRQISPIRTVWHWTTNDKEINQAIDDIDTFNAAKKPADVTFVGELLDTALKLKDLGDPLGRITISRCLVAAADSAMSTLPIADQKQIVCKLVSTAAAMPTAPTHRGCVSMIPNDMVGYEPLVSHALALIDSSNCPSCPLLTSELSTIRRSYADGEAFDYAIVVSATAVRVYDKFLPQTSAAMHEHEEYGKLLLRNAYLRNRTDPEAQRQLEIASQIAKTIGASDEESFGIKSNLR